MTERGPADQPTGTSLPGEVSALHLFATPIMYTTMPDAERINTALRKTILEREAHTESVERSNRGGWQSSWDLHEWGGDEMRAVLEFARLVVDQLTVDRSGQHHQLQWRINCWANVNRTGHGNQYHTHPGALWSASYYVDDGGIGDDPSLGGEFEIQDPRGVAPIMYAPQLTFPGPDGASLGESHRLQPRAGMLFVFPSWLSHGVCPYRGNRERISIAINFSVAGV